MNLYVKGNMYSNSLANVSKTASMSMPTPFESRYTLKGRYSIGNVEKTASMSIVVYLHLQTFYQKCILSLKRRS